MPTCMLLGDRYEIARNALILDTCVLVGAFCQSAQYYPHAKEFLDTCEDPVIVPVAVLVEAWGVIVGSNRDWPGGLGLLQWLLNPGFGQLLPQHARPLDQVAGAIRQLHVDCVDALISHFADEISAQWGCEPYMSVATYDVPHIRDCRRVRGLRLRVYDVETRSYCV